MGIPGRFVNHSNADTWYPSWGADGRLYSPFTDGTVDKVGPDGQVIPIKSWSGGAKAVVGHAVIEGDDPLHLKIAGHDAGGKPVWTNDFAAVKPLIDWNNFCGGVTITYNKPLNKYLMCVTNGGNTISKYDSYLLEADQITGPWRIITYLKNFGEQAYFLNIPSKFISADGRSFWLCYSANFCNLMWKRKAYAAHPPGSEYTMSLHEIRLSVEHKISGFPSLSSSPRIRSKNSENHPSLAQTMKTLATLLVLAIAFTTSAQTIVCPPDAPANMKLAAKEIRRCIYLRPGALPAIQENGSYKSHGAYVSLLIFLHEDE